MINLNKSFNCKSELDMRRYNFMRSVSLAFASFVMLAFSQGASAEWLSNRFVNQIGTYQYDTGHFVWFTGGVGGCQYSNPGNSTLRFSESNSGGKSLMEVLRTALVYGKTVDVQINGCDIIEVYLKR